MRIVTATFVQNEVEPGWSILRDDVPLGRRYRVDLDQVEQITMVNAALGKSAQLACVYVVEPPPPGWLPLLALKIEADA